MCHTPPPHTHPPGQVLPSDLRGHDERAPPAPRPRQSGTPTPPPRTAMALPQQLPALPNELFTPRQARR